MKRLLILFANGFPYNISEPFLENEYPLYREYFDQVLIITACKKGERPTRHIMDPKIEVLPDYTLSRDVGSILEALPWLLTDRLFYRELKDLILKKGFSLKRLYELVVVSLCANHRALQAYRWLKKHPEYDHAVLYGYWLYIPACSALHLNRKLRNRLCAVSRAHGYDLYLERSQTGYRPFHERMCRDLDEIASISADGKRYLEMLYEDCGKVSVYRLGAADQGVHNPCEERATFRIVTCARTIPLKRLDRVVDALSLIRDHRIHWTHIGDGEAQDALKRYAGEKLPPNITVEFTGSIPNKQVYEMYQTTTFHVFVNVSETEGVPVSIMEALSFDIPTIATAVGGTPELIDEGQNGFLLEPDFENEDLARLLRKMIDMPEQEYRMLRAAARQKYDLEFNAGVNNRKFIEKCLVCNIRSLYGK